ncbi:NAD-binding protein [Altererythrobacter salegens]|uniref:NAD-binding protein n=1 Tax=Croceibacterium salegens TaxID=1737568 RepID=A0A6I4SXQ4_9SPHN|nr:NAD(P)-dependent oxidoreductase [Croceibacterium salegens]MXO59920.1 NAD-binding protein [Croceibacterium salegens]
MTTVGFLGLGRMGAPMAANLLGHVDRLLVHDISPDAVAALVAKGAEAAGSAAALGAQCDIVLMSLPTPPIVRAAAAEILSGGHLRILCDLSTSGPKLAQELHDMASAQGVASFDAPVSGGIRGAELGTLAIMCGGPEVLWGEIEPIVQRLGKPFYMGETPGAGQVTKLANNLLSLAAIATTAEAMTLGIKAGLDPARMIEVLNAGTGANSATRDKWPRSVLPRTFDFGFSAQLSLKDTRLALDEAAAMGVPLPTGERLAALLDRTLATYGDDADFTAMAKVVEGDAGLDPERAA